MYTSRQLLPVPYYSTPLNILPFIHSPLFINNDITSPIGHLYVPPTAINIFNAESGINKTIQFSATQNEKG